MPLGTLLPLLRQDLGPAGSVVWAQLGHSCVGTVWVSGVGTAGSVV